MKKIFITMIALFQVNTMANPIGQINSQQKSLTPKLNISKSKSTKSIPISFHGGQEGNGGSGVRKNGKVMTFYTAKVYAETLAYSNEQIIQELVDDLSNIQHFPPRLMSALINATKPSNNRTYVNISDMNEQTKKRILAEIQRVTGVDHSKMTLFALTDYYSETTFILPEFYQLNRNEQKSILFHQAARIVAPKVHYKKIIESEMLFQHYLEAPEDRLGLYKLILIIGRYPDVLHFSLTTDLARNELDFALSPDGQYLLVEKLFGPHFLNNSSSGSSSPFYLESGFVLEKLKSHPNSLFYKNLAKILSSENFEMSFSKSVYYLNNEYNSQFGISIDDLLNIEESYRFNNISFSSKQKLVSTKEWNNEVNFEFKFEIKELNKLN